MMAKHGKKYLEAAEKIDQDKAYEPDWERRCGSLYLQKEILLEKRRPLVLITLPTTS
jgi:hypothetical protein